MIKHSKILKKIDYCLVNTVCQNSIAYRVNISLEFLSSVTTLINNDKLFLKLIFNFLYITHIDKQDASIKSPETKK